MDQTQNKTPKAGEVYKKGDVAIRITRGGANPKGQTRRGRQGRFPIEALPVSLEGFRLVSAD